MTLAFIQAHLLYRSRSVAVAFVYGKSRAPERNLSTQAVAAQTSLKVATNLETTSE
jgi:hypothetical protein